MPINASQCNSEDLTETECLPSPLTVTLSVPVFVHELSCLPHLLTVIALQDLHIFNKGLVATNHFSVYYCLWICLLT